MLYLAGDVGGTKVLLQLVKEQADQSFQLIGERRYLCKDFDSLEAILQRFFDDFNVSSEIEQACLGLPGPVNGRSAQLTNLPWYVDAEKIEQACSIKQVSLINDFYAAANGVDVLQPDDLITLHQSKTSTASFRPDGNRLVIGAGTGLGVAPVFYDGARYIPQSSEGGHFEFAPISMTQQWLLQWLWAEWEHVSYERVLSGPGLETLYTFFKMTDCATTYETKDSQNLKKSSLSTEENSRLGVIIAQTESTALTRSYSAEQIYQAAQRGESSAVKALTEFVTIYGAYIGAAALIWNAPGGIYLAGGIASKMIDWMSKPYFLKAYLEKGRMAPLVEAMPVYLVTNESLGLKGAMHFNQQNSK